ncbi:MAG: protein kinase domain-containing protein [Vicinamibacterales bacterium]
MSLTPGTRLGPYEVVAPIGAGGMGEVYRARDTRLHRDVALKILPDVFALNPDRVARLEREAQVLAALNHSNIASIFGFEQAGGISALALEMVEGPTLAERIADAPLSVEEALLIARQIAAALEAAHESGIIHRDLKPANIKVRPDGTVKVLDFGLAKAVDSGASGSGSASMSPTLTTPAVTGVGTIMGTAAYMAPEQARGRAVDKRADIWAFGCVLFEMLTGRRAFEGGDVTDVLASVIKTDPEWEALPPDLPAAVRMTIRHCLMKDPAHRIRDIGDTRLALSGAFNTETPVPTVSQVIVPRRSARTAATVAIAAVTAAALAAVVTLLLTRPAPPPVDRMAILHSDPSARFGGAAGTDVVVTPDGRHVAYTAGTQGDVRLYLRALDQLAPAPIAANIRNPLHLMMSPDGQWIGFGDPTEQMIKKVSINGGPPLQIASLPTGAGYVGAAWSPDDSIIFGTSAAGLMRVSPGGTPDALTKADQANGELAHRFPYLLPGGRALLFTIFPSDGQPDNMQIALLDLRSRAHRVIVRGGGFPVYVESGHIVYGNAGTLRAVRFDLDRLEARGNPVAVVEGIITKSGGAASFAVSANGTLTYVAGAAATARRTVVWVDRQGREEETNVPPRAYAYARLSPDGGRVALDIRDDQNDIWTWDLTRKTLTRLTFNPGINRAPVWTPDGTRIAFSMAGIGAEPVFIQAADGSGTPTRVTPDKGTFMPVSFTPDGKRLLLHPSAAAPYDLQIVDTEAKTAPTPLLAEPHSESNGVVSPDGRWLAYQSNESGRDEIYVRPFPNVNSGRWQVSADGGTRPLWSRDGRELFYYLPPGVIMAAPIGPGSSFTPGTPTVVLKGTYLSPQTGRMYDVSPDGRRFLLIKESRGEGAAPPPPQLIVVQHWLEELKRLVP